MELSSPPPLVPASLLDEIMLRGVAAMRRAASRSRSSRCVQQRPVARAGTGRRADVLAACLGDAGFSAASVSASTAASRCAPAPADVRTGGQSQRKVRARNYAPESGMTFIELARQYDYLEFEERLKALPGVLRVEHSKKKTPGTITCRPTCMYSL